MEKTTQTQQRRQTREILMEQRHKEQQYIQIFEKQVVFVDKLPVNVRDSLHKYTHGYYEEINQAMRGQITPTKDIQTHIDNILMAFRNVPPIEKSIILYRGQKGDEKKIFDTKSITSTTYDIQVVSDFIGSECCLYVFNVQAGSKILPLYTLSHHPHEFEVILEPGGVFTHTMTTQALADLGQFGKHMLETYYITYLPTQTHVVRNSDEVIKNSQVHEQKSQTKEMFPIDKFIDAMKELANDELGYDLQNEEEFVQCYEDVKATISSRFKIKVPTLAQVKERFKLSGGGRRSKNVTHKERY
jgi:hypothetical protein